MKKKHILALSLISLFVSALAQAQTAVFTGTTLVGDDAPDPVGIGDFFGDHVASNGDWLMIGAPRENIDFDNNGVDPGQGDVQVGAVYIYKRTPAGPMFHQKIEGEGNNVDPDTTGDRFGAGIVLQGDIMFVGAANDNNFPGLVDPTPDPDQDFFFAGQVYVFDYDTMADEWMLVQKLTSDEPNSLGSFGARTDSSHMELFSFDKGKGGLRKIALIGEIENGSGLPPSLHVFKRKNKNSAWERVQKIGAPSGVVGALFADKVEGLGELALVSESGIDPILDPAAVHVYRIDEDGIGKVRGVLMPFQTLVSPNGPNDTIVCFAGFGDGLDAAGDIVAIGDPCDNAAGQAAGAVFVYTVDRMGNNDPLSLVQTLTSPNPAPFAFFGSNLGNGKQTVTTDGNLIAVGTANFGGPLQDDVHLYARDTGGDTFSLADSVPSPAAGFPTFETYGQSVTLLGDGQLAIGQMSDPDMLSFKGRVLLFDIQ